MAAPLTFLWVGNHPATDLCNTRPVVQGQPVELLPDFESLMPWVEVAGVLTDVEAEGMSSRERQKTIAFVHRLREALRPLLESGRRDADALRSLNEIVATEAGVLTVSFTRPDPLILAAQTDGQQLRLDLVVAVLDIFRYDARLVRRCANPSCVLVFLDISKSGRRRWCDMATCGNRAKASAHYARTRAR
jgi:predicted RNA-binding Zn ribbon-like protein